MPNTLIKNAVAQPLCPVVCRPSSGKPSKPVSGKLSDKPEDNPFAAIPAAMPYQQHPMTQITPRLIAALTVRVNP